ncbi:MAG: FHA domain-containing protein [Bdellovibrionales bacterium]|nr:FHA domain-containing protein [Bdellovibrionales bacterium]
MIELEILSSPDQDIVGAHIYHKKSLRIGRSLQNDIIIMDPMIELNHLEFIVEKNIIISSINSTPFFISNKKIINEVIYKLGEEIKIGKTILKITKHIPILPEDDSDFKKNYQMIEDEKPAIIEVLDNLEVELKLVECERYVD